MQDKILKQHMDDDKAFQDKIGRVLFGDADTQEIGMKQQVEEIYTILVQIKGITNFFGGVKWILGFLVVAAAAVLVFKK